MTQYTVDFTYKIEEYGVVELEADDIEQAEEFAKEYITDTYPDVTDIAIDGIKEVPFRHVKEVTFGHVKELK